MAMAPLPYVAGPSRVPLPYGLFSALAFRPASGVDRWEVGGVRWEEFTCEPVAGFGGVECDPDEPVTGLPLTLDKLSTADGEANTFTVSGHYTCTPMGNSVGYAHEQAVKHLELREEARVERALWTGDLGNTPNFADPDVTDVGEFSILNGTAELEQAFAETYGSQGVLHMSRKNALVAFDKGVLEKRGGRLYTKLDTPVVAGTGYGHDKLVMTSQLLGYRSDIFPGDQGLNFLDRSQNNLTAVAYRTYLMGYDQSCGVLSATIATATP